MFTIQSIMLVSLGFLMALLVVLVVAPVYWGRAVRLTTERIRQTLPISEPEIRAERDRLRAQHAIRVHQLTTRVDAAQMSAARQKVEINRREAAISDLERQLSDLNINFEASENARHVLEQTILDRVPRVEERLGEARKALFQRDREMAALQADTAKTFRALDEAMQINAQQRLEIDRLKSSVATRTGRNAKHPATPHHDSELAVRSELEALRTRVRDQASLITKLQDGLAQRKAADTYGPASAQQAKRDSSIAELDSGLQNAKSILTSLADNDDNAVAEQAEAMKLLKAQNETLVAEIEKLKASLQVYESVDGAGKSGALRDSRISLKARVAALEKETSGQAETIRRLRAELASATDRSARQAAQHLAELRRLGAGTVPAMLDERPADNNADVRHPKRQSLTHRITQSVPTTSADLARSPAAETHKVATNGLAAGPADPTDRRAGNPVATDLRKPAPADADTDAQVSRNTEIADAVDETTTTPKRSSLLQRIAGLGKD